jgi:hypothetical protein
MLTPLMKPKLMTRNGHSAYCRRNEFISNWVVPRIKCFSKIATHFSLIISQLTAEQYKEAAGPAQTPE